MLESIEKSKKHCRYGAYTAFLLAIFNGLLVSVLLVLYEDIKDNDFYRLLADPINYFDVVLLFFCGLGLLFKFSRLAALVLIFHSLLSATFVFLETGALNSFFITAIVLFFYIRAAIGAFAYQKFRKENDPDYKPVSKWISYPFYILFTLLFLLMSFGLITMTGFIPSTEVLAGNKIPNNFIEQLRSENIIDEDENVTFFYSEGFLSILEGGNILTDRRIISYEAGDGEEINIYSTPLEDVEIVDITEKGDFLNDTWVKIKTKYDDSFYLVLSAENDGDIKFIDAVRHKVGAKKLRESYLLETHNIEEKNAP